LTRYHKFTDLPACSEPKERDCTIPGTRKAIALGTRQASAHCAAALQRRPMQTPQQKTLRRALQGNPEACDHSEIAGRNRPASRPKRAGSPGQAPLSGHTGAPQHLRGQRRRAQAPNSARRAAGPHPSPRRILLPWHDDRTPAGTHRCPSQPRNLQLSLFQIGDPPLSLKRPEPTVVPKPTGTQG
jgi:hypothetical protein